MTLTQITTGGVDENINIDSNTLKVDGTNNRVGINTAAPDYALHAVGTIAARDSGTNTDIRLIPGSQQGKYSINANTAQHIFVSGANERMRIDSSGNVGIGTANPSSALHLSGTDTAYSGNVAVGAIATIADTAGRTVQIVAPGSVGEGGIGTSTNHDFTLFTGNSEKIRLKQNGNVGIGTTAPGDKLAVSDGSNITELSGYSVYFKSDSTGYIQAGPQGGSSGRLVFQTNTAERMRIDSAGNVGIGTSSPTEKLTVTGGNIQVDASSRKIGFKLSGNSNAGYLIPYTSGGNTELVNERSGSNLIFKTANTERMRIDGSGNVGIGNTSPSDKLHVGGNIRFGTNTTYYGVIEHEAGVTGANIYTSKDTGGHIWKTGTTPAERMRLDNSGRLFIGSTTFTSNNTVKVNMSFAGGNAEYGMCMNAGSLVAGTKYITFDISTTQYGSIGWTGTQIGFYNTSDYRLKENIVDLEGGIERLKQLQPRRFNFTHNRDMTVDGFVAHEAQAVIPEAVSGTHNEVDSDGKPVYQNIDHTKFVPLLTAALQEAITKIETLEAKVAALEAAE